MAEEKTEKEGVKEEATKEKSEKTEGEKVEVPEKFKELVEKIEKMTVLDLAELVKVLEKKFGVSATPQVVTAPAAASTGQGEGGQAPKEEKSVFNVVLTGIGDKKIEVIKVVRDITGKGLKDSKDIVDAVSSGPQVIKENVKKEEAEEMKKKFEAAGAKVELK